jgi:hypothetical protein
MKWRSFDLITSILAAIGFIISIILYEFSILSNYEIFDMVKYPNAIDHPRVDNLFTEILRIIILTTTLLAVVTLIIRHYYKYIWLNCFFNRSNDPFSPILSEDIIKQYGEQITG